MKRETLEAVILQQLRRTPEGLTATQITGLDCDDEISNEVDYSLARLEKRNAIRFNETTLVYTAMN